MRPCLGWGVFCDVVFLYNCLGTKQLKNEVRGIFQHLIFYFADTQQNVQKDNVTM